MCRRLSRWYVSVRWTGIHFSLAGIGSVAGNEMRKYFPMPTRQFNCVRCELCCVQQWSNGAVSTHKIHIFNSIQRCIYPEMCHVMTAVENKIDNFFFARERVRLSTRCTCVCVCALMMACQMFCATQSRMSNRCAVMARQTFIHICTYIAIELKWPFCLHATRWRAREREREREQKSWRKKSMWWRKWVHYTATAAGCSFKKRKMMMVTVTVLKYINDSCSECALQNRRVCCRCRCRYRRRRRRRHRRCGAKDGTAVIQ